MQTHGKTPPVFAKDQIVTGALFPEPMRVITAQVDGGGGWTLELAGTQSEKYRKIILPAADCETLQIQEPNSDYQGDGERLRLGLQAHVLGIAYAFDPYFGLSISRVDPLPHQLDAVYEHLLKLARVRFLLADDAGAGKTVMAGLLLRELQMRGLAKRVLVVCPSNLAFQWQRELAEKFDEKFVVMRGADMREQFGVNQWLERDKIITSLDLAKRDDILPGLRQARWDLVIVDEAHRMSARDAEHKSQRYRLGEMLRDASDHLLLLTATPHKGDPENFTLFLQLLDKDAYADVKSIRQAMQNRRAPFYLRRTKEAMVYFPTRGADCKWRAAPIFTRRIPRTVGFSITGDEFALYESITRFIKRQCRRAAAQGDERRARAVGFLMALYQRRLASSARAAGRSLSNRARRLEEGLKRAQALAKQAPAEMPSEDEFEEMDDAEREKWERMAEAVTLTGGAAEARAETAELRALAAQAEAVEQSGAEAKLAKLKTLLHEEKFFDNTGKRLLIFTEFKDTLTYLAEKLESWNFTVGRIHGGMKSGHRDQPGSRLHAEQQFRAGEIQILIATEAAGEGINLQACNILFNYDIPWNPNRLEQRMGRIHRYGQRRDCLIFNFVASNTVEGRVLQKLLDKLEEIRRALDDDAVFNVVGEVLPAAHIERVLRAYYAGQLGDDAMEARILQDVDEQHFRAICQTALEGLAARKLNLEMLVERRARATERRLVPEDIARFFINAAAVMRFALKLHGRAPHHTFTPGPTPAALRRLASAADWPYPALAARYPRCSTDRNMAERRGWEWVTPGHPLFESLRRHTLHEAREHFARGASYYSVSHERPARLDFYHARVADGRGDVIHERIFVVEVTAGDGDGDGDGTGDGATRRCEPGVLGDFTPAPTPAELPPVAFAGDAEAWLRENALQPFLEAIKTERLAEVERVARHVELSLGELLHRADLDIGRASQEKETGAPGADGRLAKAEQRYDELSLRRERRRAELQRRRAIVLQAPVRLTSVLVLPHPQRAAAEVHNLRPSAATEAVAMRVAMEYERAAGRRVEDVSASNLGYDLTSFDAGSGEMRLIEVKGLAAPEGGDIILTPNERRVAEDRRDIYYLYIVTNCAAAPVLHDPVRDPASRDWHGVPKIAHYRLSVNALTQPMQIREESPDYGAEE